MRSEGTAGLPFSELCWPNRADLWQPTEGLLDPGRTVIGNWSIGFHMRRRQPKLIPVRPSREDGMLHDTTGEWGRSIPQGRRTLLVCDGAYHDHAYDETHGGVASGPLG